jgi:hypothetical protein
VHGAMFSLSWIIGIFLACPHQSLSKLADFVLAAAWMSVE